MALGLVGLGACAIYSRILQSRAINSHACVHDGLSVALLAFCVGCLPLGDVSSMETGEI